MEGNCNTEKKIYITGQAHGSLHVGYTHHSFHSSQYQKCCRSSIPFLTFHPPNKDNFLSPVVYTVLISYLRLNHSPGWLILGAPASFEETPSPPSCIWPDLLVQKDNHTAVVINHLRPQKEGSCFRRVFYVVCDLVFRKTFDHAPIVFIF